MSAGRRPLLSEAPEAVRDVVAGLLGEPVVGERAAEAGFTPSIASVVSGRSRARLFVKVAQVGDGLGEAVEAGTALAEAVGDLGPRLLGAGSCGDWRVAAYEVVDGTAIQGWSTADVDELLQVIARMRERLEPCLVGGVRPYADDFVPLLGNWATLGVSRPPLPGEPRLRTMQRDQAEHLLSWLDRRLRRQ